MGYDVLFGAYQPSAYWWFMQVLWLKTGINMLFTFGYFGTFKWHLWVHLLLAASVCLMVLAAPHTNLVDSTIELFVLVCLAGVTHVASIFKSGEEWTARYLVATAVLALLPLVATIGMTFTMKKHVKLNRTASASQRNLFKEFAIDESHISRPLDFGNLQSLSVSQLRGLASERGVPQAKLTATDDAQESLKGALTSFLSGLQEEREVQIEQSNAEKLRREKRKSQE